ALLCSLILVNMGRAQTREVGEGSGVALAQAGGAEQSSRESVTPERIAEASGAEPSDIWANKLHSDIGTALKIAISRFGKAGGKIRIGCGRYQTAVGGIEVNLPNISIQGQNSDCVSITYTGTVDFLRVQMKPFTVTQAGMIGGMSITCAAECR